MNKKIFSKKIVGAAIAVAFAAGISMRSVAAGDYQDFTPKSYGTFTYDDGDASNNNGHDHDLFIDTSDLVNLANIYQNHIDSDIIDTLEGIKENTEKDKAAGANAVKELMQAFQDGVNKIYNKLDGLGFTPETNSPDDINVSIQKIYDSRYKKGYEDGNNAAQVYVINKSYDFGYGNGQRIQTANVETGINTSQYTIKAAGITSVSINGVYDSNDLNGGIYAANSSATISISGSTATISFSHVPSIHLEYNGSSFCTVNYFVVYTKK